MRSRRIPRSSHPLEPREGFHFAKPGTVQPARLKYCTARSCFCAAARDENVPRFFRFPVFASFLREYKRYSPDSSLRIIRKKMPMGSSRLAVKSNRKAKEQRSVLIRANSWQTLIPRNTSPRDDARPEPKWIALAPEEILKSAALRHFLRASVAQTTSSDLPN
jgi:hypothetical protein